MIKVKSFKKYALYNAADIVFQDGMKEGQYKVDWGSSILTDVFRYQFEKIGRDGDEFEHEEMLQALNHYYATKRKKGEALRGAYVKVPQNSIDHGDVTHETALEAILMRWNYQRSALVN